MSQRYFQFTFANGLTLLGEKMPSVQSAALTIMLPAGSAYDPDDRQGMATVLSDLVLRGAGSRNSRELTDYLDSLGLHRSSSVSVNHLRLGCAAVAPRVMESLAAYGDIVRRPHLPATGFDAARDLAAQALQGLADDPRQKLLVCLREQFLPPPLGRNPMGRIEDLERLTDQQCREHWQRYSQASGMIVAAAGNVDFELLQREVEKYFGDMKADAPAALPVAVTPPRYHHEAQASEQTHIGIAYPSLQETDPDYYLMRMGIEVLSGGMSGRLFTEVREKRGLCYSVWAGYTSMKGMGAVLGYAGTSNERAQATLDCMLGEIARLGDGITAAELQRAKIGLKAGMVMQGESSSARAGAIAHDYFMRGRIRTLDEISAAIDAVTVEAVNEYLARSRPERFTIVTVGPQALKTQEEVSAVSSR